jgi:hypothetical protein
MKKIEIRACYECPRHEHDNQEAPELYGKHVCWDRNNIHDDDDSQMPVILTNDCYSTISPNCGLDDA